MNTTTEQTTKLNEVFSLISTLDKGFNKNRPANVARQSAKVTSSAFEQ